MDKQGKKKQKEANQGKAKQDAQRFQDKKMSEIFDIITGEYYYAPRPFTNDDLHPDMIIKWKVPSLQAIKRTYFNHISAFVNLPEEKLQEAYTLAEKKILNEMQAQNQNTDMNEIKIRLQTSIKQLKGGEPKKKITSLLLQTDEPEVLQFNCLEEKHKKLDGFTLYFNSVVYILQKHCGFKVRAFMVHKSQIQLEGLLGLITDLFELTPLIKRFGLGGAPKQIKYIYLYLNLSNENLMKIANRYRIKKSIDTTNFDFSLNDPIAKDNRPLKLHSSLRKEKKYSTDLKRLSRYFQTFEDIETNAQISEELPLTLYQQQSFKSYWQESTLVLNYFCKNLEDEASNEQKIYIYETNRGKLNLGCQKMLAKGKKRREYYQLLKQICEKYGFPYYDQAECYGQFILPSKKSKGGFFQKLSLTLSYNPVYTTPFGDLSLFSSMQRIKISYLLLKSTFKISYLNQIGIDIFAMNNDFQKEGKGGENLTVKGGLDGTFVTDRWNIYALFSDIRLIRNYYGQAVAYEIMLKGRIIIYLLSMTVPYILMYILETLYGDLVSVVTSLIETGLFAVSFGVFTFLIQQEEQRFIIQYEDNRQERVFLKYFRGPYIRNPLTDQMNEYKEQEGVLAIVKSFICIVMLGILIIIFAYIFYGCRQFHLAIYDSLYAYQYSVFNLSAIISYSMYFCIGDVFKIKFYGFIVKLMILIKNPPDEQSQNGLKSYFTFYYLLSLELIPILFYYILEPISGLECFGNCFDQYLLYVTARFTFSLVFALVKLVTVVIVGTAQRQAQKLGQVITGTITGTINEEKSVNNFQEKLKNLILDSIKQSQRDAYEEQLAKDIIALFSYSFYCTQFSLSGVIAFLYICTIYVTTRASLIHENRRPINKSTRIIRFSRYCRAIYFCGLIANIWVNTFMLFYVEKYYTFLYKWAPSPLTQQTSFMVKILATAFFFLMFSVCGVIVRQIAEAFSVQTLFNRQRNKYKGYLQNVKRPKSKQNKIQNVQPLKFLGRVLNPEKMPHEILRDRIQSMKVQSMNSSQNSKMSEAGYSKNQQANVSKSQVRLLHAEEKI